MESKLPVVFAPDWRAGGGYQDLLAEALNEQGADVSFLSDYHRMLPLTRGLRKGGAKPSILHLHWPEAYYRSESKTKSFLRSVRFIPDLWLATKAAGRKLAITAHNLWPHNFTPGPLSRWNLTRAYQLADAVFAHSEKAAETVAREFPTSAGKFTITPHGDLSPSLPPPVSREAAKRKLGLPDDPFFLFFGTVEPYKGVEELIRLWPDGVPLHIAGRPYCEEYSNALRNAVVNRPWIHLHLEGRVSDEDLNLWLSAASACVFAYRAILTSGAACLARARGLPVLLPERLETIDLLEPDTAVIRFQETPESLKTKTDSIFHNTALSTNLLKYKNQCSWREIAVTTMQTYHRIAAP